MRVRKTAEKRREEIVDAALSLIDRAGLAGATTSAIAEVVGISQAGVFRHFRKKDDILLAVIDEIAGQVMTRLKDAADRASSPVAQLQAFVECLLGTVRDRPVMPAILFSRELHNENAVLRSAVYEQIGWTHDLLAEILSAGITDGTFRTGLDVDRAAFLVIGLMQGLVVRWSLSDSRLDLLEEGRSMFELLLLGLMAQKGKRE